MGDVLRTLPSARLVRAGLPAARLFWVVDQRWASLLEGHPDLTGTVPLPRSAWQTLAGAPRRWPLLAGTVLEWKRQLRGLHAGLVLDFHGTFRSGVVGLWSGAPVRLGYAGHQQKEGNRLFTTHRVAPGPRRQSRVERNLRMVRALGLAVEPLPHAGLPLTPAQSRAALEIVRRWTGAGEPYAIVSPGASSRQAYKKPPTALLAAAIRVLKAEGVLPLVVHGPGEYDDARRVVEASGGGGVLAPPTDVHVLAALLRRARQFVGGDSGGLHLACAVGCPVVALYGPTDPVVNAPWGVPHQTVAPRGRVYHGIKRRDRRSGGFDGIAPADVERAVRTLLSATRRTDASSSVG